VLDQIRTQQNLSIRTVDSDAHEVADLLDLATSQADRTQIPQNQVVVCAASLQPVSMLDERRSKRTRVGDYLLSISLEFRLRDLQKGGGDGGNSLIMYRLGQLIKANKI